jgi:hypothetical protein
MILIISGRNDTHAIIVQKELQVQGHVTKIFDLGDFTDNLLLVHQIDNTTSDKFLAANSSRFDLSDLTSVWFRRPRHPQTSNLVTNREDRSFCYAEWINAIDGILSLDVKSVNPLHFQQAARKPKQLEIARGVGFEFQRH